MQNTYSENPVEGIVGQLAYPDNGFRVETRVNSQEGKAKTVTLTFAGTWAPADDTTTTIGGHSVATTLAAGEDTVQEARDAHYDDLIADADVMELVTVEKSGSDTLVIKGVEMGEGSGNYLDYPVTNVTNTAGNGDVTVATTQAAQDRQDLAFGVGVALDTTDTRGKRATLPSGTGFKFGGITVHTHAVANRSLAANKGIPAKQPFNALMEGYVRVKPEDSPTPGDSVFLRHTANGTNKPGGIRTDADTNRADQITGRFVTGKNANGTAIIHVG